VRRHFIFQADDSYLLELKAAWDEKIKEAFSKLHNFNLNEPERVVANAE
jgi:predicted proteasome-type protease